MKRKGGKGKKKKKTLWEKGPGGGIGPQVEADTFDISRVRQQDSDISKGGREEGAQRALRGKQREHPHPTALIRLHPASPAVRPCVRAATAPINGARRDAALPGPAVGGGSTALPPPQIAAGSGPTAPHSPRRRGGQRGGGTRAYAHTHTHTRVPVRTHGRTHTRTCVRTGARAYIRACVHSRIYMRAGCMHVHVHTYIRGYEYMLYLGTRICTDTDTDTHASTEAGVRAHPSLHTHGRTHYTRAGLPAHAPTQAQARPHTQPGAPTRVHRPQRGPVPPRCRPPHPQRREVDLVQAPRRRVARHVSSAAAGEAAPPPPSWQWRPARR